MSTLFRPAITLLLVMTLLTGVIYPLAVTGIARVVFQDQAAGSLVTQDDHVVGSRLIGHKPFIS